MSGHRISDVATRSGFSTSTLRYYEAVGLLAPARTDAGYRVYDDRTVEWLDFVSRAKGLGLSLDEIRELAPLWDGDRCASTAGRLRALVGTRISTVQDRIAELVALTATLRRVESELVLEATEDPCGDGCVCQTAGTTAVASAAAPPAAAATTAPVAAEVSPGKLPNACTLEPDDVPDRIRDWKALIAEAIARDDIDGGARLAFPPGHDLAARVAGLAAAEQSCCAFFDFTLRITAEATVLEARAPEGGQEMIAALLDATP